MGPMPEVKLKRGFVTIKPGNMLVLYSDGLIERQDRYGVPLEVERVKKLVIEHQNHPSEEIVNILIDSAYNFGGKSKWKDDVTVVVVKKHF